jgi:hypothetical protein
VIREKFKEEIKILSEDMRSHTVEENIKRIHTIEQQYITFETDKEYKKRITKASKD